MLVEFQCFLNVYFKLQVVAVRTRLRAKMRASNEDNLINSEFEVVLLRTFYGFDFCEVFMFCSNCSYVRLIFM